MRKAKFNRPLTIAFNNEMFQKIKQKSDEHEISMASWVRQAIDKILSGRNEEIKGCEECRQENCHSEKSHDNVTA